MNKKINTRQASRQKWVTRMKSDKDGRGCLKSGTLWGPTKGRSKGLIKEKKKKKNIAKLKLDGEH
jgi:hypothetical protein